MRLTLRLLGLDLIDFEFNTDAPAEEEADEGAELAGGTLGFTLMDVGQADTCMGFTNGREVGDE